MDELKISLINAIINLLNLNFLTEGEFEKFVARHCDRCSELFVDKRSVGFCHAVSKEILFLELLVDTLPSHADDVFRKELASVGKNLINIVGLFLFARSFKPIIGCDTERHLVLSKLIKISCQINEAVP